MQKRWLRHVPEQDVNAVKGQIMAAEPVLRRLRMLLQMELDSSIKSMAKEADYADASWPMRQADKLGEQRALRAVINLLDLNKIEDDKDG